MNIETIAFLIGTLFSLGFVGYILYGFYLLLSGSVKNARDRFVLGYQNTVSGNLKEHYGKFLANQFAYYDKLPEKQKIKFILRLRKFISEKKFVGRDELEVTEEMKILVAASAIQLTFGLDNFVLSRFHTILLFPASFYNKRNDAWHMGETNPGGIIVLSWQDLREGFSRKDDTYNVGLHEMAHALELQYLLKDDYDYFFGNYFAKWSHLAESEFQNLQDERESFFRKYAGVNRMEFFAVSVEYFFEASEEFKARLPQMYYHLCILLNQDPLHSDASAMKTSRKSQEELGLEVSTLAPLQATGISAWAVVRNYAILLFVFSALTIQGFNSAPTLLCFSLPGGALFAILLLFKLNRLILYENYLVIRSVFGRTKTIYVLEEVVSFEFSDEDARLTTILARDGKITKHRDHYFADDETVETLKGKLREKNVLVR
jgi:Mlc titration factor MtfA (ptsG expression regulator)